MTRTETVSRTDELRAQIHEIYSQQPAIIPRLSQLNTQKLAGEERVRALQLNLARGDKSSAAEIARLRAELTGLEDEISGLRRLQGELDEKAIPLRHELKQTEAAEKSREAAEREGAEFAEFQAYLTELAKDLKYHFESSCVALGKIRLASKEANEKFGARGGPAAFERIITRPFQNPLIRLTAHEGWTGTRVLNYPNELTVCGLIPPPAWIAGNGNGNSNARKK